MVDRYEQDVYISNWLTGKDLLASTLWLTIAKMQAPFARFLLVEIEQYPGGSEVADKNKFDNLRSSIDFADN